LFIGEFYVKIIKRPKLEVDGVDRFEINAERLVTKEDFRYGIWEKERARKKHHQMNTEEILSSAFRSRIVRTKEEQEDWERRREEEANNAIEEKKTEGDKFLNYFTKAVKKKNKIKE
jgi:hypothetical protein